MGVFNRSGKTTDWSFADALLKHRGPDDRGHYQDPAGRMEILFRRLSIIDVGGGHQPVFNADKTVAVVLNGEIYNYRELRSELLASGAQLRTEGDSEVIAFLYDRHGPELVHRLEGMFSILLWDEKSGVLHVFRDRFGIKPLYYAQSPSHVAFASEVKPLLRLPFVSRELSAPGVAQYLAHGYTLAPNTLFADVRKVSPASRLEVSSTGVREFSYWDLDPKRQENLDDEELLGAFDRSIELHLRSDVKVGAFLSGGFDSSLVVARSMALGGELSTYTLKFKDAGIDESPVALDVAKMHGTVHRTIEASGEDFLESLPTLAWAYDEPLADSGTFPNYLISREAAKDGCKVVLSGTGGDELFAGYVYHVRTELERRVRAADPLARIGGRALGGELGRKLYRTGSYDADPVAHYLGHTTVFPRTEDFSPAFTEPTQKGQWMRNFIDRGGDPVTARLYADLHTYVPDNLMLLFDRATMAMSLEGRVPFLHRPLVEAALAIPSEQRTPNGERKGRLKALARRFLPESVYSLPKQGFSSPMQVWLNGPLGRLVEQTLHSKSIRKRIWWNAEMFSEASLRAMNAHQRWTLFQLELFCRVHVDSPNRNVAPTSEELLADG